jgi:integrase
MFCGLRMKSPGKHPDRALSPLKINAIKQPGRYADGNGLYLIVAETGSKRWMLRTVVKGRRSDIGLGGAQLVSLQEARQKAAELRKTARAGGDPLAQKRAMKRIPTFAEAAALVHREHKPSWRNEKHAHQWINTLEVYANPTIGDRRVNEIDTPDVLKVLLPIWLTKEETARRVKQRIRTVLDWAKVAGYRSGENPVDSVARGLPKQSRTQKHHAALPYQDVPTFIKRMRNSQNSLPAKLAFQFLILTATRTDEVLRLPWSEIDGDVWTLPGVRTKAKREIQIPLGPRCLEILEQAKTLPGRSHYVFPGLAEGKPLSNMVFLMALKRMELNSQVTGHGFRSTFTDWAHETTNFARLVVEKALNHVISDKTEAAYRRGDLFKKRRELMLAWEKYCYSEVHNGNEPAL